MVGLKVSTSQVRPENDRPTVKYFLPIISLITASVLACAADKPSVYNFATEEGAESDRETRKLLSPKFNVVDIRDTAKNARPKPTAGTLPHTAIAESGKPLAEWTFLSTQHSEAANRNEGIIVAEAGHANQ